MSAQPATRPIRADNEWPTKAYTDPAELNSPASRMKPKATSPTPRPATTKASGAARPSCWAAAMPVTDMARVGAITPTDTAAVSRNPSSRRSMSALGPALAAVRALTGSPLRASAHRSLVPLLGTDAPAMLARSSGQPSAVGDEHRAGDVGSLLRTQPDRGRCDLAGLGDAAQRHGAQQLVADL